MRHSSGLSGRAELQQRALSLRFLEILTWSNAGGGIDQLGSCDFESIGQNFVTNCEIQLALKIDHSRT